MNALYISHVTKTYGSFIAVDDLSLEIKEGEFFGLLGPNGAGKSTTIQCITGISQFNEGIITVFDKDVQKDYRAARALVGLAPQDPTVEPFATTKEILWYMGGYYGIPKKDRAVRIEELVDQFHLRGYEDKQFRKLSGGYKRRVLLARAMVHRPKLLILDEPTAGVDVELRHELWKILQELNKAGTTIILTSHYLEEVELLCNRIAIITDGKVQKIGDKGDFVNEGRTLEKYYLELTKKQA